MGAACGPTDESQAEPRVRQLASLTRLLTRFRGDKQARRLSYTRPKVECRVCDSQWEAGYMGKLDYFNQAFLGNGNARDGNLENLISGFKLPLLIKL